jgi:HSP20 family protein
MLEQMAAERRRGPGGEWMPVNVFEEDDSVIVEAAMPRVRPEDVALDCSDNVLTIRGRAQIPPREYLHQEMLSAEYHRQIALPGDCRFEEAAASVEDGVLTVRVPKSRPRTPGKIRIQINRRDADR